MPIDVYAAVGALVQAEATRSGRAQTRTPVSVVSSSADRSVAEEEPPVQDALTGPRVAEHRRPARPVSGALRRLAAMFR